MLFDGFRWDYTSSADAQPAAADGAGVHGQNLIPSFPSKTFPNHYTIVTGLILAITGSSPKLLRSIDRADVCDGQVRRGAGPNVVGRHADLDADRVRGPRIGAAVLAGSEAPHDGIRPRTGSRTTRTVPAVARVDQLFQWLDLPVGAAAGSPHGSTSRMQIGRGPRDGPESQQVRDAIARDDGLSDN